MSTIPNEEECIRILLEEGVHDRVIRHVCVVKAVAEVIGKRCGADLDLVRAGSLLHDLGRSRTHDIRHGVEGALLARGRGLSEPLALIIQKHIGAGITADSARALGLPEMDYVPTTLEERIVCHADNLVGDTEVLTSQESYVNFVRKGLEEQGRNMLSMHSELSAACGMDIDDIVRLVDLSDNAPILGSSAKA